MDLSQTKLTRSEWNSAEIPVPEKEKEVLSLIMQGYYNTSIRINTHLSLLGYMRVEQTEEMDYLLYSKYFLPLVRQCIELTTSSDEVFIAINTWLKTVQTRKIKQPHKADLIRIQNVDNTIASQRYSIFEFVLLDYSLCALNKKPISGVSPQKALYTLLSLRNVSVRLINQFVIAFVDTIIQNMNSISSPELINHTFSCATDMIEKNGMLMEYADQTLYSHQRDLFTLFSDRSRRRVPKLVLYIAPTGTGKTLSPLGLSQDYRVIFVCGARHVGLALAKSAISVGKRVAFAFGCTTSSDIRLHYFAAADYTVNKKTGGIFKVDNSNGTRVEIMICDIASYLVAMYYMQAFHNEEDIVTYWDEPTITMDYEEHSLHTIIHRAWSKNQISKMVLSCATLPSAEEIGGVIHDFKTKFYEEDDENEEIKDPEIHIIHSHDCKKTISLMNKDGKMSLPHLLFPSYADLIACVEHCEQNKALLRYMDIAEIVRFCTFVQSQLQNEMRIESKFSRIDRITLNSIKLYYLEVLKELPADNWTIIYQTFHSTTQNPNLNGEMLRKIQSEQPTVSQPSSLYAPSGGKPLVRQASVATPPAMNGNTTASSGSTGILLTTADAHTLTDGPTIYLAEDVDKIGRFYIQQSKIPESVFATIQQKIDKNQLIQQNIQRLEQEYELKMGTQTTTPSSKEKDYSKKATKEPVTREMQQLADRIAELRESIHAVHLSPVYIPNTKQHQDVWVPPRKGYVKNAFTPNVEEDTVREIMGLDVSNQLKLLLILGIGVFSMHENTAYMEIMKRLANEQRLFLIIASSDYIYGTNYQFCHGFIGKDLTNMTQQKTIQAIGRIGRNNIQQEYTVRFRDDTVLQRLFTRMEHNLEATVMNRLFTTDEDDI